MSADWHKTDTACSAPDPNENAASDGAERGVNKDKEAPQLLLDDTKTITVTAIFDYIRWVMDKHDRAVLAAADSPLPTFLSPMYDARFWASLANRLELKAYALAAFEAMGHRDQAAFLDHVTDRQVAA